MLPSLLAAAPPAESLSIFDPASPPAESIRSLFYLVLAVTGVIFLLVEGLLLYCIFRFRRRPAGDPREPPQIYGSQPIELAWTVAPLLVVFVLFLVVVRTVAEIRPSQSPEGALQVTVIGHQWWWEYEYYDLVKTDSDAPERRLLFKTANELVVPIHQPVVLELKSNDVVHSFWVPRLAGKTDLIPGRTNRTWFQAREEGLFLGQCAEYCGTQHANMLLRVLVRSPEEFDRWREAQRQRAADVPAGQTGKKLFLSLACVNCHTIRGTPAQGTFGPDLTHLASRQTIAAGLVPNNRENLTRWVDDPRQIKPGCKMPSFQLGEAQVRDIVTYLETLR